jgi:mRNA-degrading endonuclease RelE of RelBE toxin-antitoxin system
MNIVYAEEFKKQFHKLPSPLQKQFKIQEKRFKADWRDPRLHCKKLKGSSTAFSFRVTRSWRVLFAFVDTETALFATIGHRRNVYR